MTVPTLRVSPDNPSEIPADVLAIAVQKTEDGPRLLTELPELAQLAGALESIGVTGAQDEVRRIPLAVGASASVALVGLGSSIDADAVRYAAGTVARQLRGVETILLSFPADSPELVAAALEGAALGAYAYTAYLSASLDSAKPPASTVVVAAEGDHAASVDRALAVGEAVHIVRDLVNAPPSDLYPETFVAEVERLLADTDVTTTVLREPELEEGGFGGILGVGRGSVRGPRLVVARYEPEGATQHLALVGKGITFDSGGLSLKPAASMVGMKYDMTGAATVFAVVRAVAALRLPIKVTAWLCLAENMPSGSASRPNDVLRIRGGKTVEVLNTDAEGRLVLADGLVAASEEQPDAIVDVATLTGAARVALGDRYTGVMGDDDFVRTVVDTGTSVGEPLWPMPLPSELRPLLASDVADIANAKPGNTAAGMLLAAVFLREFVGSAGEGAGSIPWAHLDIAGPANNGAAGYGYTGKGPSGVAVRTLVALAERMGAA